MATVTVKPGELVFKQGEFPAKMYEILTGRIGIYADYGTDKEKLVAELGPGETFGEMGMLEVRPRSATAAALDEEVTLEEIGEDELSDYFNNRPEKLLEILRLLSRRLRETNEKYIGACKAIYENEAAEKTGAAKSSTLREQLDHYDRVHSAGNPDL